jgi:hypothetical protein
MDVLDGALAQLRRETIIRINPYRTILIIQIQMHLGGMDEFGIP